MGEEGVPEGEGGGESSDGESVQLGYVGGDGVVGESLFGCRFCGRVGVGVSRERKREREETRGV